MKIIKNKPEYIDQLVVLVEEYREFCGFNSSPEETKFFFSNLQKNNEAITFIAVDERTDTVMGFVNLYPSYSTLSLRRLWILNDLGVAKAFQGYGVAKALIKKVLSFAESTGAVRIELKTEKSNATARKLYQSLGFKADDEHIYYRVPVESYDRTY